MTSDVTFTPLIAVGPDAETYRALAGSSTPWARLLVAHLDRWFGHPRGHPASMQHDALT